MPDVYISNKKSLIILNKKFNEYKCDILLGIFKIREDQRGKLGQVKFDENNNLVDVIDKDKKCTYKWAWGIMQWNRKLFEYINPMESHIGYSLLPALKNGLNIKVQKIDGTYYDCGTLDEYKLLLKYIT